MTGRVNRVTSVMLLEHLSTGILEVGPRPVDPDSEKTQVDPELLRSPSALVWVTGSLVYVPLPGESVGVPGNAFQDYRASLPQPAILG